jgi:hypothetical protein
MARDIGTLIILSGQEVQTDSSYGREALPANKCGQLSGLNQVVTSPGKHVHIAQLVLKDVKPIQFHIIDSPQLCCLRIYTIGCYYYYDFFFFLLLFFCQIYS